MISKTFVLTDYSRLRRQIGEIVGACQVCEFDGCVRSLLAGARDAFPALWSATNPVLLLLDELGAEDVQFLIQEYSGFSNASVHMLFEARIRNHWPSLREELVRNLDEELGLLADAVPHLELMRYGYRGELDIETDGVDHSLATAEFIEKMYRLFRHRDNGYLAGVLLAFEGVAVEEFRIVERLLQRRQELLGLNLSKQSLTIRYVAGHVSPGGSPADEDPELSHFQGMMEAVGADARRADLAPLVHGFLAVAFELNRWWENLARETLQRTVRLRLSPQARPWKELYATLVSTATRAGGQTEFRDSAPVA